MNRNLIIVFFIGGYLSAQPNTTASTPLEVCASFVSEISALASKHAELAEFPEYAETLNSVSRVHFYRHTRPVLEKRIIQPSDFERHGIILQFELIEEVDGQKTLRAAKSTFFPHLMLRLYSNVNLWEGASPELKKQLEDIMERHKTMLLELDLKKSNREPADKK